MQVALLADDPQQQQLLEQLLGQFGYQLVLSGLPNAQLELSQYQADLWLVSIKDPDNLPEGLLEQLYDSDVPVLVDDVPVQVLETEDLLRWQRSLLSKLALAICTQSPAAEVWLLAASLGGLPAVKEFLDHLPVDLPLCLLYAQHIEPSFEAQLPQAVGRHSQWPVRLAEHGQSVQPGEVLVVPTEQQLEFSADGHVLLLDQPWQGQYSPSIEQLVVSLSRRFGKHSGLIVFSGMGEDGSIACVTAAQQGMRIWLQDSASCVCPAMPDSVRQTGLSSYSATPRHLALALSHHVKARYGALVKE